MVTFHHILRIPANNSSYSILNFIHPFNHYYLARIFMDFPNFETNNEDISLEIRKKKPKKKQLFSDQEYNNSVSLIPPPTADNTTAPSTLSNSTSEQEATTTATKSSTTTTTTTTPPSDPLTSPQSNFSFTTPQGQAIELQHIPNLNAYITTRQIFNKNDILSMKIAQKHEQYRQLAFSKAGITYLPHMYFDEYMNGVENKQQESINVKNRDGTYNEAVVKENYMRNKQSDSKIFLDLLKSLDEKLDYQREAKSEQVIVAGKGGFNGISELQLGLEEKKRALQNTEEARKAFIRENLAGVNGGAVKMGGNGTDGSCLQNNYRERDRDYVKRDDKNIGFDKTVLESLRAKAGPTQEVEKFRNHLKSQK